MGKWTKRTHKSNTTTTHPRTIWTGVERAVNRQEYDRQPEKETATTTVTTEQGERKSERINAQAGLEGNQSPP